VRRGCLSADGEFAPADWDDAGYCDIVQPASDIIQQVLDVVQSFQGVTQPATDVVWQFTAASNDEDAARDCPPLPTYSASQTAANDHAHWHGWITQIVVGICSTVVVIAILAIVIVVCKRKADV
jgi:hypothetical protein